MGSASKSRVGEGATAGERIDELRIKAFRGVPGELCIELEGGASLAVYGDNGTGKSSLADALEWYFTGQIELLAHEGRQHAVRNLGSPKESATTVELRTNGSLGGSAVFPEGGNVTAQQAAGRETFLLRGRTLADFINKTKTEKWRALAEILGLEEVESLRSDLQRARTELRKRAKTAEEELRACREALAPGGGEIDEAAILGGLQEICRGLGFAPPESLARVSDPGWQLGFAARQVGRKPADQRQLLDTEIAALATPALDRSSLDGWNHLVAGDGQVLLRLLESGRALVAARAADGPDHGCPLCGQSIPPAELAARIETELKAVAGAAAEFEEARAMVTEQLALLAAAVEQREALRLKGGLLGLRLSPVPRLPMRQLQASLEEEQVVVFGEGWLDELAAWDEGVRGAFAAVAESPAKASDQQLDMLVQLCRQIESWHSAELRAAHARRARELGDRVYAAYEKRQQRHVSEILARINQRVADIYEALHPGEGLGGVSVEPWTAKGIELAIVFHGSRQRPPHGVLSESHLNSLAIAVFLAMAETFNERLGFLVLDDVINSFDLEHRGSLAELLAGKTDWQLIVLTHDRQFYEHLTRRAPSWRRLELTSWSFEEGPRTTAYRSGDLLAAARARLDDGDLNGAATKARRALEEQLQEVCEGLGAPLPFRRGVANDRRELGQLFQGVRRVLKDRAKPLLEELEALLRDLEADVAATLNVEAHASRGRAAGPEVQAALGRIESLDRTWTCTSCGTRIWLKGTPDAARCRCGASRFPPA